MFVNGKIGWTPLLGCWTYKRFTARPLEFGRRGDGRKRFRKTQRKMETSTEACSAHVRVWGQSVFLYNRGKDSTRLTFIRHLLVQPGLCLKYHCCSECSYLRALSTATTCCPSLPHTKPQQKASESCILVLSFWRQFLPSCWPFSVSHLIIRIVNIDLGLEVREVGGVHISKFEML